MRTRDNLTKIKDISILIQYLYMSKEHNIIFFNGVVNLKFSMDEEFNIYAKNMYFSEDLPPLYFNSSFDIRYMLSLIEQLKKAPPEEDYFENRWEEILKITKGNLGLNR